MDEAHFDLGAITVNRMETSAGVDLSNDDPSLETTLNAIQHYIAKSKQPLAITIIFIDEQGNMRVYQSTSESTMALYGNTGNALGDDFVASAPVITVDEHSDNITLYVHEADTGYTDLLEQYKFTPRPDVAQTLVNMPGYQPTRSFPTLRDLVIEGGDTRTLTL